MPNSKKLILAVIFLVTILASFLTIWLSQKSGEQGDSEAESSRLTSSQATVEFRLVPYARAYDITNRKGAPEFLFESHYRVMRIRPGVYVFQFDYGNRSTWRKVRVGRAQKCTVSVDLRF